MNDIVWFGVWFRQHNNVRILELLSRLSQIDTYKIYLSANPIIWRIQHRLHSYIYPKLIYPSIFKRLSSKYKFLFCSNLYQIPLFEGNIIVDYDDPAFSQYEVDMLSNPKVKCVVTTTEMLKEKLVTIGVNRDVIVIPQGVNFKGIDNEKVEEIAASIKQPEDIIIGFDAPYLLLDKDISKRQAGHQVNSMDYLLSVIEKVKKDQPNIKLWLLGKASKSLINYAKERAWIKIFGYIHHNNILNYVKNFDIAVYPRLVDFGGRFSIKLLEYMACGVPIVSTNVSESFIVKQGDSGLIASTYDEFVGHILNLCQNEKMRNYFGNKGIIFASKYNWDIIAERYQKEVIDIYCI